MDNITQRQRIVKLGCSNCGHEVNEWDIGSHRERHGMESPPYESFESCPYCGGADLIHMEECAVCEGLTDVEALTAGVCEHCAIDNFTIELGQAYLKDTGQELEFYSWSQDIKVEVGENANVGWYKKLSELFRSAFLVNAQVLPEMEKQRMIDWIFEDYENYCAWLAGKEDQE